MSLLDEFHGEAIRAAHEDLAYAMEAIMAFRRGDNVDGVSTYNAEAGAYLIAEGLAALRALAWGRRG